MPRTAPAIQLSEHFKDGKFAGYKKFVLGRMFYFGKATGRQAAEAKALRLVHAAQRLRATGQRGWTAEVLADALDFETDATAVDPSVVPFSYPDGPSFTRPVILPSTPAAAPTTLTLHQGVDRYLTHLRRRPVSEHTLWWQFFTMKLVKASYPDCALNAVGFDQLAEIIGIFTSRPKGRKTGRPLSVSTVRTAVGHLRSLFDYLADAGHWEECRRYHRLFRFREAALLTGQERVGRAAGVQSFTVDELAELWRQRSRRGRAICV